MSDETMPQEVDEAIDRVDDVVEESASELEDAATEIEAEAVTEAEAEAEAPEEEVAAVSDELDERVETAVRNVAEEAEEEAEAPVAEPEPAEEPARKKRERRSKQARAAKAASATSEIEAPAAPKQAATGRLSKLGSAAWLGICAISLVAGLLLGRFVLGGSAAGVSLNGVSSVEESKLGDPYATYTYNGKTETLTIQDILDASGQAETYKNEDGTYNLPSAEVALSAARNAIVQTEMDARGIEASDKDVDAFAEAQLGMSDYDALAEAYGVDADTLKEQVASACRLDKLRKEVIDVEVPEQAAAPEQPEEGKETEATKEYADYIFGLAGDEWDAEKGEWVDESSAYATALKDYDISEDGATYEAAQAAYYVAYQNYAQASTEYNEQWNSFLNGLLVNANIQVGTLVM